MKIEEAAKEYADSIVPLDGHDKYSAPFITAFERHEDVDDAFKAGVEFAQRWIPVDEELPDEGEKVLIKIRVAESNTQEGYFDFVQIGFYLEEKLFDIEQMAGFTVTHWRKIELT
jgi:hypothetical protein